MNYADLLRKYIDHVGMMEGTVFIPYDTNNPEPFTSDELDALHWLAGPYYRQQARKFLERRYSHDELQAVDGRDREPGTAGDAEETAEPA